MLGVPNTFHENIRGRSVTLAHRDVEHELGMPLDCDEGMNIAEVLVVLRLETLLFLADECPQFVTFNIAHLDAANLFRHDALALLAREDEPDNGVDGPFGFGCADYCPGRCISTDRGFALHD